MTDHVYLNGDIVEAGHARVSAFDAGFTHAAGLFETMRAYSGRVMRLHEHVDRLQQSAAKLELQIRITEQEVANAIARLLDANNLRDARIRLVATPGNVPRPGDTEPPAQTILISATQVQPYPPQLYAHGMRVCICDHRQNPQDPIAGHKTLAYFPRLIAMKQAAARQCQEALWFTTNHLLAEGCVCNVFIVYNGELLTPPLDTPVLPGTTRGTVLELARANGIPADERPIDIDTLLASTEVFLTGSVLEIMPVTAIEKHQVAEGEPGPVTKRLQSLYKELIAKECGLG